jgi:hypothetical protein
MAKYDVSQMVMCEVSVWYVVEADSHTEALLEVSKINCPTCANGRDFEINSDCNILSTSVKRIIK